MDSWRDRRNAVVSSLDSAATPSRRTRRARSVLATIQAFSAFLTLPWRCASHPLARTVCNAVSCVATRRLSRSIFERPFILFCARQFGVNRLASETRKREDLSADAGRPSLIVALASEIPLLYTVRVHFSLCTRLPRARRDYSDRFKSLSIVRAPKYLNVVLFEPTRAIGPFACCE